MKAPVTVWFWIFYVIFFLDQADIVLFQQKICQRVDILLKGTDHPHAGDICKFPAHIVDRYRKAPALHFFQNARRPFEPCLDRLKRIPVVEKREFLI